MDLLITFLYIVFVLAAIVLVVVILLQEGKGGGLTSALGTSGQQTFGVGASGINKFTGWTGAVFLLSALAIHYFNRIDSQSSVGGNFGLPTETLQNDPNAPANGGAPTGNPTPPPAGTQTPPSQTPPPATPPSVPPK
jgi:preprotein translocase subunit SecG